MDVISKHVDGRWSIAVAIASFLAQGLLGGHAYTTGIFYAIFKEQFPDVSDVAISWMCNLPLTLWFLTGPLGSVLTNRYGCRICGLVGGLLSSLGLALCFVSTSFYMVFMFYGVLAGVGNGIHFVGFITVVNRYFKRYRLIANIATSVGVTSGMALYAALIPSLTATFGWKGTLLILGGLSFNLCALACALYPTESTKSSRRVLNVGLLKDIPFVVYCVQNLFCNLSSSLLFLHLPALILSFGFSMSVMSLSLTVYGIANCVGKICQSLFWYFFKPDASVIYTASLTICGTVIIIFPLLHNQIWIFTLVVILGGTYCVTGGYGVEVIHGLVGIENISDGLGFSQVAKASGSLLAGPLAGMLYEWSGLYETSFFLAGGVMITSCILMLPVMRAMRTRRRKGALTNMHCIDIS